MLAYLPAWPEPERYMFESDAAYLSARNNYLRYEERRQKQIIFHQMFFTIMIYALLAMAAVTVLGLAYLTYHMFWS